MLEWIRIRDDNTCEVYYRLYNHDITDYVATIHKADYRYKVQIMDHVPYTTKSVNIAKTSCEHIYVQTSMK